MAKRLFGWLTVRRLATAIIFLSIFTLAVRFAVDPDMWWHLRTGQYIIENRTIPREDIFSYTVNGKRWITHEWLTQIMMYAIYYVGGRTGLILATAATVTATFALVYIQCDNRPYIAGFLILLGASASAMMWGPRPQLATVFLATLFIVLLETYRRGGNRRVLWAFPILMALWVNLHGGYFLGLGLVAVVLGVDAAARIIKHTSDRTLTWPQWRALALTLLLCIVATLANPNTYHMLIYPFETLGSNAMQVYIQEWHSPNFHEVIYWPFAALLLGGAALQVLWRKEPVDLTDLALFLGLGFAGLLSIRHIPLFCVVAVPIVSRAPGKIRLPTSRRGGWPALNWAILLILLIVAGLRTGDILARNAQLEAERYPIDALAYIEEHGMADQRIYNSYNWGGYLIWYEIPVYIDGRADVYMDEFIGQYVQAYHLTGDWRVPLDAYDVDYVLIEEGLSLSYVLETSREWERVYEDDVATIFVREPEDG